MLTSDRLHHRVCVPLLFCVLVRTVQSTCTPTSDCTWQHGARAGTPGGTFTTTLNQLQYAIRSSVGVMILLMASLFHPCMVGSMSGGFASSPCFQMQHCKWLSAHLVETIHSLGVEISTLVRTQYWLLVCSLFTS